MTMPTEASRTEFQLLCERAAKRCLRQAAWPSLLVAIALAASSFWFENALITPLVFIASYAVFALSALLVFDALLFRLMASYPNDTAGGAAVDDLLARMRLKPRPPATRPVKDRIRGSERILLIQRLAFAVFALCWLAAGWQIG